MTQHQLIHSLEEIAANAWPTEVTQVVDGWRLRSNGGATRRANSVWPNRSGESLSLTEKLALVEDFYARRGSPPCYYICPAVQPTDLDGLLEARGYSTDAHTAVQIASLAQILTRTETSTMPVVTVSETFNEAWFNFYHQTEKGNTGSMDKLHHIFQLIGPRAGFALLHTNTGQPIATGLGVVERGWLGLFCIVTHPQFRRQGAAINIIRALAQWGQTYGAAQVYLQVMAGNAPALALYARLGFETLYHYHYRALA